jgi:predicted DCC family thiol-disulfide oxidoreductase YuxK
MAASHQPGITASMPKVTCFHDGECPLCNIEINAMKKLDKEGNINWVDITRDKAALAKAGSTNKQIGE